MAYRLLLYTLWTFAISHVAIATALFNLSTEITNFIPTCARGCFLSFLGVNFSPTTCGTSPSLQCLCSVEGVSGYTIGEGAVQCLVAENSIGFCDGYDVGSAIVQRAYEMCSGQIGAIQPTHATIVATLIVPQTSPGVIIMPTPTNPPPATSSATTTMPTFESSTLRSTPSTTSQPPSSSPDQVQTAQPGPSSGSLSKTQVAGMSVGVVAAVGLAVGAILLARYRRRKDYPDLKSGFFPVRDSWDVSSSGGPRKTIFFISSPLHNQAMRTPTPPPKEYQRQSYRPETIGLAISGPSAPAAAAVATSRSPPRQQSFEPPPPAKPALSISIPHETSLRPPPRTEVRAAAAPLGSQSQAETQGGVRGQTPSAQMALLTAPPPLSKNIRDSALTEFEEDDRDSAPMAIWRPPSAVAGDRRSATTYYVADKSGNWVLGDPKRISYIAELDSTTPTGATAPQKQRDEEALAAASAETSRAAVPTRPRPALQAPAEIKRAGEGSRTADLSRASSVYSQDSPIHDMASAPPVPPIIFTTAQRRNNSLSRRPSERQQPSARPERSASRDSATTIASESAFGDAEDGGTTGSSLLPDVKNLSPVVESPQSSGGVSPVKYPRIHGRPQQKMATLEPPRWPRRESPPAQSSPDLGPFQPTGAQNRLRAPYQDRAQPAAALVYRPGEARRVEQPSRNMYGKLRQPPRLTDPSVFRTGSPTMRIVPPSFDREAPQPPSQSSYEPVKHSPSLVPRPLKLPPNQHSGVPRTAATRGPQPSASQPGPDPGTSSLLAKRLGRERAAALTLDDGEASAQRWRQLSMDRGTAAGGEESHRAVMSPALPVTPGWQPKLTPTRRGDDLFLNVH